MPGINALKRLLLGHTGFTLVEAAVALSILSTGVGLVGAGVFQVLAIQRFWQDDQFATKDARHAASWFAGDALKAVDTSLGLGASDDNVALVWEDGSTITYTYRPAEEKLEREKSGTVNVVATKVESVDFLLSTDGEVLTFTIGVQAAKGNTETLSLENYLRLAQ